jgi:hypothetical protein
MCTSSVQVCNYVAAYVSVHSDFSICITGVLTVFVLLLLLLLLLLLFATFSGLCLQYGEVGGRPACVHG